MSEENDLALDALLEFLNAVEAGIAVAKRVISEGKGISGQFAVKEDTFNCLTWEKQTGHKIGEFGVATKKNNIPEKFQHAYNILNKSNAVISNRYHGGGYIFSYWLYQEKIYRQELRKSEAEAPAAKKSVGDVRKAFPKDLADLLAFEDAADAIILKPRKFLGTENFAKILDIVKKHNGKYVSAGKNSHFKIPR